MKSFLTYITAIIMMTSFGGQALAKDVCAVDPGGAIFVFKNVKPLKKPGQVSPLNGLLIAGGAIPINGTATVLADKSVLVGLNIIRTLSSLSWTLEGQGPALNTMTNGNVINIFDNSNFAESWTPFNCKDVVIPNTP